ncbi:hypothetical protein PRIPAC_77615 [Pristionchus pacificus]|uniref:Uncharacterized protein n=1 Tax=Pristionchus pacificus TaxID=54126 RepID=A0A2A6CLZ6_PRIPA|nr:hypothetical protein PRIPAC_77615 [Pristionchus pacificus]|eukprot:PDM79234.1 hypothetical protein PRIPAC_31813 [Pristionchus pacificus]
MLHLLIIAAALISQSAAQAGQKCFIAASSSVPRSLIRTVIVTSPTGCNVICFDDIKCEAVQFNAAKNECSILGPLLPTNQCSSPYTAYEKRPNSECSCDAILHNGTRLVLENYHLASISWDSYLGSFLYILGGTNYYFKSGTCVRPPPKAAPGCECVPAVLPSDAPIAGYVVTGAAPAVDVTPMCTSALTQYVITMIVVSTDGRALFCAMGEWKTVVETTAGSVYTEYAAMPEYLSSLEALMLLLLLSISVLFSQSAAQKCFIAAPSNVPRAVLDTVRVTSPVGCNCEAVQFNTATGECSLLGPFLPANQCSSPYTAYEKRPLSECATVPKTFGIDAGYTAGGCSGLSDVVGPPKVMDQPPCGSFPIGQGRVIFDAILHNGTHLVLENYRLAFVSWDGYLGSFLYNLGGRNYYFKSGTCVRVPSKALPGCECVPATLPVEQPITGYKDAGVVPVVDVTPMCTSSLTQIRLKRVPSPVSGNDVEAPSTVGRSVFCAMGEWMTVVESATEYSEYSLTAATCVEPGCTGYADAVDCSFPSLVAQKCFIAVSSNVPRRVLDTVKVTSPVGCNATCAETPQCEACSFNAGTSVCTLLGPAFTGSFCAATQIIYEKRANTECQVIPQQFVVDDNYSPGSCSDASNVVAAPASRTSPPCGVWSPGYRRIVFDAIMHNGSHVVFENYGTGALVDWDDVVGSWFFHVGDNNFFFKSGTCVRPPARPMPGCDCIPALPTEAPMAGYRDDGVAATMDLAPVCPNLVQLHVRRATFNGVESEVVNTVGRAIYCAMRTWMNIIEEGTTYLEYTVVAVTCVDRI